MAFRYQPFTDFCTAIRVIPSSHLARLAMLIVGSSVAEAAGIIVLVPLLKAMGNKNPSITLFRGENGPMGSLFAFLGVFAGFIILRALLEYWKSVSTIELQVKVVEKLRADCFRGLVHAEWKWLAGKNPSHHVALIAANIGLVGTGLGNLINQMSTALSAIAYVAIAFVIDWQLSLIATIVGIFAVVALSVSRLDTEPLGENLRIANRALHSSAIEGMHSARLTKILGFEKQQEIRFEKSLADVSRALQTHTIRNSRRRATAQIGGSLLAIILVCAGLWFWAVPIERLLPILLIFVRLVPMADRVRHDLNQWILAGPSLHEVTSLAAQTALYAEQSADDQPWVLQQAIKLEAVSFTYEGRSRTSLSDISLTLPVHTTTSIIGESGAGKSSIADILTGLISPDTGKMLVDGNEVLATGRKSWRRAIAYVQQDTFLFHDTIRANLQIAVPGACDADLYRSLKLASADFVEHLPQKLDTIIGGAGAQLSGGERQRIALARALIVNPQVLILDEVTSALDSENEATIGRAIDALHGRVTLVIFGHRPMKLEHMDQTITVGSGRIVSIRPG